MNKSYVQHYCHYFNVVKVKNNLLKILKLTKERTIHQVYRSYEIISLATSSSD